MNIELNNLKLREILNKISVGGSNGLISLTYQGQELLTSLQFNTTNKSFSINFNPKENLKIKSNFEVVDNKDAFNNQK